MEEQLEQWNKIKNHEHYTEIFSLFLVLSSGIGLSAVGNSRGYKTVIVIADTQSIEKKNTLRYGGAHLLEVPAVPFKNPLNYVHVAARMAEQLKKEGKARVLYADQWFLNLH